MESLMLSRVKGPLFIWVHVVDGTVLFKSRQNA
jgi:hypothetical protein